MKMSTHMIRVATLAAAVAGGFGATAAWAGGNGNGGNGSGGAHGAATSGMTYHSEPVGSPWNRPYGDALKMSSKAQSGAPMAARSTEEYASKEAQ